MGRRRGIDRTCFVNPHERSLCQHDRRATIASASFAQTVLAAGVNAVWAAAMTNAGATVLDHLPHGSFFHATGGSIGMDLKERLRLIPYESLIGLVLVSMTVVMMLIIN